MKKIIERQLPFTSRYQVQSICAEGLEAGCCNCDNCGRQIANRAYVKDGQGVPFVIGLDCLKTLAEAGVLDKSNSLKSQDDIANAFLVASLVGFASQGSTIEKDFLYVTVTKGDKTKQCFAHLVQQYAPVFFQGIH